MKPLHALPLLLLLLVSCGGIGQAYSTGPAPEAQIPKLIAHWSFDETSGLAIDSIGGHQGTVSHVTRGVQGVMGSAYLFDGKTSRVTMADAPSLSQKTWSVATWVWVNTKQNVVLVSKGLFPGYNYKLDAVGDWFGAAVGVNTRQGPEQMIARWDDTPYPMKTWNHLVATYDGASLRLYVNGKLRRTTKLTDKGPVLSNQPLVIGTYVQDNYPVLDGAMDEVMLYAGALSAADVAHLYDVQKAGLQDCQNCEPSLAVMPMVRKQLVR